MNSITISTRNKTNLTQKLETVFDIQYYKKPSIFQKLIFKKPKKVDIYFHRGLFNSEAIFLINEAKVVILNSEGVKFELLKRLPGIDQSKLHIVYPYILTKTLYDKNIKKEFKEKYNINKKNKILFFRAKDVNKGGVVFLLDMINQMYQENFTLVIESSAKQIAPLEFQINRTKLKYQIILLKDYENIDHLFISSDIFILPTQQTYFATDVLKAMYFKNAIFLMQSNYAIKLLDTFSRIEANEDRSISFKVDSLLINKDELKSIQKTNHKRSLEFTFDNCFTKVSKIIKDNFDI
jgi:hypothetical protein